MRREKQDTQFSLSGDVMCVTEGKTRDETYHDEVGEVDEDHGDQACEESEEELHSASYVPSSTSSFDFGTKS